jgi:hypothetical protein
LVSYQNGPIAQEVSAELILVLSRQGKLPVTVTANFTNSGLDRKIKCFRIYGSRKCWNEPFNFIKIEPIAQKAIDGKWLPECRF